MQLTTSTIKKIQKNRALVRALEDFHEKAPHTMAVWLRANNPMLCHINSLKIIAAYLKQDMDSLLEKTEADFIDVA